MKQNYCLRHEVKTSKNINFKNIAIVILAAAVVILLGVIMNLKRAYSLREYSISNNCTWTYMNTAYGDDRDWVCK